MLPLTHKVGFERRVIVERTVGAQYLESINRSKGGVGANLETRTKIMSNQGKTLPPSAVQSSVARLYVANRQKLVSSIYL